MSSVDKGFAGSIPQVYESHLVPLIFEQYAADLVNRLLPRPVTRLLEVAAGTGAVTRALASGLDPQVAIVATDLNPPMLEQAQARGTSRPVEWRQADALHLPFEDASFDAVVCQFGAMFFPDKPTAFSEARRVLRPGGVFLFNVWGALEENEFAHEVTSSLASLFPQDPPRFLARTPYGYYDRDVLIRDVRAGGFSAPVEVDTVTTRSVADSPQTPAAAYCQGTPLRTEIEARDKDGLDRATQAAADAIARRFGPGPVDGQIQAHVVTVSV